MNFKNKTYFITGATSNLGMKFCEVLDSLEANLIILYNSQSKIIDLKKKILKKKHHFFKLDFDKPEKIKSFIEKNYKNLQKIDGLVNFAGLHTFKPALSSTLDDLNKMTNINFISPIILINNLIKKKIFSDNSSIILVSSASSLKSDQGLSLYSSTKLAQKSYFKTLLNEVHKKKILINFISPGLVNSDTLSKIKKLIPSDVFSKLKSKHLNGFGKNSDVTHLIMFLLSEESNWINGSDIIIDGGYSISS